MNKHLSDKVESLLCYAIDLDQMMILQLESLGMPYPPGSEIASALSSISDRTMKNAQTLRQVQRWLRRYDGQVSKVKEPPTIRTSRR